MWSRLRFFRTSPPILPGENNLRKVFQLKYHRGGQTIEVCCRPSAIRARQEAGDVLRTSGQDYVIESRGFDQKGFHLLSKWTRGNEGVGTDKYEWELSMEQVLKFVKN